MSVAAAREAAFKFDPDSAIASSAAGTFKTVAEDWVREYVDEKRLRSRYEIVRHLTAYVFPEWEKRPIYDIRRADVNKLLDGIKRNHGRTQADAVLATVRSIMTWYATRDDRYNSPLVPKMGRDQRTSNERARSRILDDGEIRAVWRACGEMGTYGALVKELLLSGQRLTKVAAMQWDDISDDGVWTIRAEEREKGTAGKLKLPKLALDIVEQQPRIKGNPHVFAAARGKGPLNGFSKCKAELNGKLAKDMPAWVLHDLRRTARSLMARAKVADNVAERTLGHAIRGIEAVYNRHDYFEEKADALTRLAALVEMILNPPEGNVIALRR
jgi:integrase